MDILQATKPVPVNTVASDKVDSAAPSQEGQTSEAAFAKLLQGMQAAPENVVVPELDALAQAQLELPSLDVDASADIAALGVAGLLGQVQHLERAETDTETDPQDQMQCLDASEFALVAQTQRMDAEDVNARALSHDGTALQVRSDVGAQPHVAVGHSVATVAAGVQGADFVRAGNALYPAMAAASVTITEATPVAESVADLLSIGAESDRGLDEGRLVLQGAWKLDEPAQAHPVLQRLMGQVEQWAAAVAGVQPKTTGERVEAKSGAAQAAESLLAGQGSGTRLTETAVKETQAAQDAVLDAQAEAPVEDMRFWLQGKLQRAEVVLEKDGQPVRVQVSVRGNEAQVVFQTDQLQTREMLDQSMAQLRTMLEAQGVQLAGVSVQADAQGNSSGGSPRNPWGGDGAQQAQVEVPLAQAASVRGARSHGVDFYA